MTDMSPDQTNPDDAVASINAASFSVGTTLREARALQGLSLEDVSGRIKFAPRQIEALEADDFASLAENAFLRGFVRSYARLLQLDPIPLLDALPHEPESNAPMEVSAAAEMPYPGIYTERKYNIIWLAAALAVALVLGLFVWLFGGKQKENHATAPVVQNTQVETLALPAAVPISAVPDIEQTKAIGGVEMKQAAEVKNTPQVVPVKPVVAPIVAPVAKQEPGKAAEIKKTPQVVPVKPMAAPVVVPAVKQEPAKAAEIRNTPQVVPAKPVAVPVKQEPISVSPGQASVRMTFEGDSWTEIKDKDGNVLMGQLNHAGDERYVKGVPPFTVTFGYASGVKLFYKGKQVDLAPYTRLEVVHLTLE